MTHETAGEDVLSSRGISGSLGLRQDCSCRRNNRRCERQSRNDPTHRLAHDHLPSLSRCEEIERANALQPVRGLEYFSMTQTVDARVQLEKRISFARRSASARLWGSSPSALQRSIWKASVSRRGRLSSTHCRGVLETMPPSQ